MSPRVRLLPPMRLIQSTLHLPTVTAYTVLELPSDGPGRVFAYAYVEAQRYPMSPEESR